MNTNLAYNDFCIDNTYLNEYITNIPWDKNPAFIFSTDAKGYLEAFKNVIEKVPIGHMKINFSDDYWNFNPYFAHINSDLYRFNFKSCPKEIIDFEKFFVIYTIMHSKGISTANIRYSASKRILSRIINKKEITLSLITNEDIIDDIKCRNLAPATETGEFLSIYQFLYFVKNNYKINLSVDLNELWELSDKARQINSNIDTLTPNIPEEYFLSIKRMAIKVMRNEELTHNERMAACFTLMLCETGMRIGDILRLEVDDLKSQTLSKSGHCVKYIHYKSQKPSKPNQPMLQFDIYCTALGAEAFETAKKLRKKCKAHKKVNYLFILKEITNSSTDFPINNSRMYRNYQKLIYDYLPNDCLREWENAISPSKMYGKTVYIPTTPQFRVHLCSHLYNERHVSLVWIQRYMGHLSNSMLGYYVRPKDTYQEDILKFGQVIREIHDEQLTPLGGDGNGAELAKRINEFLDKNDYSIYKDVEEIAQLVSDKIIIRAKTGGICIKTSLLPCSRDARTDEMMCAYELCPNLFHFYYMIDVSYNNFLTLQDTVNINLERGHLKAAQKEHKKLKNYIHRRLIPELDELDKELSSKGIDYILDHHPALIDIIEKKDIIRKEIESWLEKEIQE